jgi:sulfite reductase beta subunit-like hemoprotein
MAGLEAASTLYRDHGDRANRRHARMKYILEDRGVEWFREEVSRRLGFPLPPPAEVDDYQVDDHLGWHRQADGRWLVGVWVENGRIHDSSEVCIKTGLRAIVAETKADVRLTGQQNLILVNIPDDTRPRVEALLRQYGLHAGDAQLSTLRRFAMACPALPTCGLAVAESERYLPDVIGELEERGYGDEHVWIRMSGCPNSCSRPPTAEIGIIGRSLGLYNVYAGGSFEGTRLCQLYAPDVRAADLVNTLADMLDRWRRERREGEAFGDWSRVALFSGEPALALV